MLDNAPEIFEEARLRIQEIKTEIGKVIIGQHALVDALLIGTFAEGHLLLEGVPGVAKTLAANTLAHIIHCDFKRIQFTPDLLPADVIGTQIYNPKDGTFSIKKGPVFTHVLLADEINRAPPKVQAALLEVMQENQVSIGGETFKAPSPFLVVATQNPIEQEGTYPLSEAQTDRFMMKVKIDYPSKAEEKMILEKMGVSRSKPQVNPILGLTEISHFKTLVEQVYIDERVVDYLLNLVFATRVPETMQFKEMEGMLEYGASPRASLALKQASKARALLYGRYYVIPQDIKEIAPHVLRHRLRLSYEAEAENISSDELINRILDFIPAP